MPKPTFAEIARHARVGTATVERLLNGRMLRRHPRGRQMFFVGHELTVRSAAALTVTAESL